MTTETKQEVAVTSKPQTSKPQEEITSLAPLNLMRSFEEVERVFERLMPRGWMRPMAWEWPHWNELVEPFEGAHMPSMDVIDHDQDILVRLEVPGIDKKDIDISVTDATLTVKGSHATESKEEKPNYFRCEISRSDFSRTVALPVNVDSTKVSATLKDGILEISLPKTDGAKRHTVKVQ
jgi:HSP20 family protein